jgi:hypothetical protein
MGIAGPVLAQGSEVAARSVSFVFGEPVVRVLGVKLYEETISIRLCDD